MLYLSAFEINSAPFIPKSLSCNFRDYIVLFDNNIAAIYLAPCAPKEFFLIEPYKTPKSRVSKLTFLES